MKSVVIAYALFVVAAYGQVRTVQLTGEQKAKALQHSAECVKESGVKPEVFAEAKKGNLQEDDGLKKFTYCFYRKADIVNENGKVNIETAVSKVPPGVNKSEARKVLESCNDKSGKDAADTAFQVYKCYRQSISTPVFLGI